MKFNKNKLSRFLVFFILLVVVSPHKKEILAQIKVVSEQKTSLQKKELSPKVSIYSVPLQLVKKIKSLYSNKQSSSFYSGLDVMNVDSFKLLKDKSFALLANGTSKDSNYDDVLDLLVAQNMLPTFLLEPEHGLYGDIDEKRKESFYYERRTGIKVISLYARNATEPLTAEELKQIDYIVFDVQSLSVRAYTYVSTLTYLLELAEKNNIEVILLDRPNIYDGLKVQGERSKERYESFVGLAKVPFLYSMTLGEYAYYMQEQFHPNLDLKIIKFSSNIKKRLNTKTSIINRQSHWINPSPNIPTFEIARIYVGLVFFEGMNYSLGRGTTRPFAYSGAPWFDNHKVLLELRKLNLQGVKFTKVHFRPITSHYKNQLNYGIQIILSDDDANMLEVGYEYMRLVYHLHKEKVKFIKNKSGIYFMDKLWGTPNYRESIIQNIPFSEFQKTWQVDALRYRKLLKNYKLYK